MIAILHELISHPVDCGDYVVVTNARNVKVTGRKEEQKLYRHHTMFPGGLKERKYKDVQASKPDEVCGLAQLTLLCTHDFSNFIDHPQGRVWYAPQKQTSRQAIRTTSDIC